MIPEGGAVSISLPQSVKRVLEDKAYGHVLTFNPDGSPQLTMVWMDVEGDEVLFNTARGRLKPRNLERDSRIIISVQGRADPQAYMLLYGNATVSPDGADGHIDKLAKRFMGVDSYPFRRADEERLIVRMGVERIGGMGPKMGPWA